MERGFQGRSFPGDKDVDVAAYAWGVVAQPITHPWPMRIQAVDNFRDIRGDNFDFWWATREQSGQCRREQDTHD